MNRDISLVAVLVCGVACGASESAGADNPVTATRSLLDLSSDEQRRYGEGLREFAETDTAAEGLGPLFNAASCAECHNLGGVGGGGNMRVLRAMCLHGDGTLSAPPGGSLIHMFSTRPDVVSARVPDDCEAAVTQRRVTNVLGLGLIEAIADAAIVEVASAQPAEVRGKVAWVKDLASGEQRVGRFGWKAQHAGLLAFSGDAYLNEMGVTNELFPTEIAPMGQSALLELVDPTPDPEATVGAINRSADFMRFSSPPEQTGEHEAGLAIFRSVGCGDCHYDGYVTSSSSGTLANRKVPVYSDLLLHDIGTGPDLPQGAANEHELRTAPLWGLNRVALYLHDGRASSLSEAIAMHAGQAARSYAAFSRLSAEDRQELLSFLKSL